MNTEHEDLKVILKRLKEFGGNTNHNPVFCMLGVVLHDSILTATHTKDPDMLMVLIETLYKYIQAGHTKSVHKGLVAQMRQAIINITPIYKEFVNRV